MRLTGYFGSDTQGLRGVEDNLGLDPNTTVALSYSVKALLVLSVCAFLLVLVPILVAFIRLRGDMVIGGANSRVISAACHPHLFVSSSSIVFKSPWSGGDKIVLSTVSPRSPGSPRDTVDNTVLSPPLHGDLKTMLEELTNK